jgi:hypothetical protein
VPTVTNEGDSFVEAPGILATSKPVMNAVKTDAFSWFFGRGVLKYERVFSDNISVQLGFFYSWDFPSYDEGYFSTGFGITPEVRYYLSKEQAAPSGIYLAPNFRYQKLDSENLEENSEATVITNSIALNLGYQLVLKDLFLIDAWAGLAYNFRNVEDETVPGAQIGPNSEDGFGARIGVSIGWCFKHLGKMNTTVFIHALAVIIKNTPI